MGTTTDAVQDLPAAYGGWRTAGTGAGAAELIALVQRLVQVSAGGGEDAVEELLDLAAANPSDGSLYLEVLSELRHPGPALLRNPRRATTVLQAMGAHRRADPWPGFAIVDQVLLWLLEAARTAGAAGDLPLLAEAAAALCAWDETVDQWTPQAATQRWLRSLDGPAAVQVAGVLRRFPASARRYRNLTGERGVDLVIRSAVQHASQNQR